MSPPDDEEGVAGGPTPDDASTSEDPAAITGPVDGDRSAEATPRQPDDTAEPPEQLMLPGFARGAAEVDDARWRAAAEAEIERRRARDEEIRADQVTAKVGLPSQRNLVGNVFMTASVRGEMRKVGYVHSKASSRHGGMIAIWRAA